jgi:hypothetical protein
MGKKISWGLCLLAVFMLAVPLAGFGQEKAPAQAPQAAAPAATTPAAPAPGAPAAPAPAAKAAPTAPAAPEPIPDPKALLSKSCEFLKNQSQFSFKAEIVNDRVYRGGKKLQFGQEISASFKRPDRLRLDGDGDLEAKLLMFDGKTLTLYDKFKNHYGVIEAAGDSDAVLEKAFKDHGLKVGLAELGGAKLCDRVGKNVEHSLYAGLHKVRGVPCHHLAFDRKDIHYQLWIEAGDKPVVRKIVITQKKLPGSPQWTAYLSDWNFSPVFADNFFAFSPPPGAQKIKFLPVKSSDTPAPKKVKPKKKGDKS